MSNEVTKVNDKPFAIVASTDLMNSSFADEAQGLNITLPRVKIPSGGATSFEIDTGDSENPDTIKELRVVIIYNHPAYSYFDKQYDGENRPPVCYSNDGVNGIKFGDCNKCKYNQYNTALTGNGKACKNKRAIYMIFENQIFPSLLLLPTGSIQNFTKYVQSQMFKARKLSQVVTKITLKKATNKGGIPFSQASFVFERMLTDDERSKLTGITEFVKEYSATHTPTIQEDDDVPFDDTVVESK